MRQGGRLYALGGLPDRLDGRESEEVRAEMAMFIKGKHELFPIPAEEINLNPMEQNPGY